MLWQKIVISVVIVCTWQLNSDYIKRQKRDPVNDF